ncbi:MAG: hypothetical protein SVO01_08785 [Thermotogota bacterium]|nr:hypothetical protein [Thermotogota bacterium]
MNKVMTFLLLISLSWFLIVFSVYLKISSYGYTLEGNLKDFYIENASLMKVIPFIEEGKVVEMNGYEISRKDDEIIINRVIE